MPEEDRITGRPVVFALSGLDPDWASGVGVVVDWVTEPPPCDQRRKAAPGRSFGAFL